MNLIIPGPSVSERKEGNEHLLWPEGSVELSDCSLIIFSTTLGEGNYWPLWKERKLRLKEVK